MPDERFEIPEPSPDLDERYTGFLCYVRNDDRNDDYRITHLREQLEQEFALRTGSSLDIFQDKRDLYAGDHWRHSVDRALRDSRLLIAVVTPSFFKSDQCRREIEKFRSLHPSRESGRIIPLVYIDPGSAIPPDHPIRPIYNHTQRVDFTDARFFDHGSANYRMEIHKVTLSIIGGLRDLAPAQPPRDRLASDGALTQPPRPDEDENSRFVYIPAALRTVYIVQTVLNPPPEGSTAQYALRTANGIELLSDYVELRQGRFNISAAFREIGREGGIEFSALESNGDSRALTLDAISLPPGCSADPMSVEIDSAGDSSGRVIMELRIDYAAPSDLQDR